MNERAAYAPIGEHNPTRVVRDPTGFKLVGSRAEPGVPAIVDGLSARWSAYRFRERPGPPRRTVYYDDGNFFDFAPSTTVVVFDPVTHEEARTFEVPCPGMYEYSQDETGNTYLTSAASPVLALYGRLRGSCARRIDRDGVLDSDWRPDFTHWTGGRQLASYEYAGRGKAIATVLHHEELEALGADFDGEYDPDIYEESLNGDHYRPCVLDLEAGTAKPVRGVEPGVQTDVFQFDDRTFLNVSYDEWSRAVMYELSDDGSAERRFDVPAYVSWWIQVR